MTHTKCGMCEKIVWIISPTISFVRIHDTVFVGGVWMCKACWQRKKNE